MLMDLNKLLCFNILLLLFMACGNEGKKPLFEINIEGDQFKQYEQVAVSVLNRKKKDIDSVSYHMDGKRLPLSDGKLALDVPTLGMKTLRARIAFEGNNVEVEKKIRLLSPKAPELYTYEIVNTFPHDPNAYTQGLEFHNDTLYEGTGKMGRSSLRKVDFRTGEVLEKIDLDKSLFGEGITIFNDKIYQLTWRGGKGFVYDLGSFSKIDTFQYGESKEGWGLAHDNERLIKSDGTEKIWFLDPNTLAEQGHIELATDKSIFNKANELEYANGRLYANVYGKPGIMIINIATGAIEGVVNLGGLDRHITKNDSWDAVNNVLNGIAYHAGRQTFFVTGKNWDKLFEVTIRKK